MTNNKRKMHFGIYASAFIALALTISIIRFPEDAFDASLYGLKLWFEVVLPALLPFFAMADILMGLGVVHFVGVLLEPIMRPVFKMPGVGAFAVAMGLASGYPIGAKITGRLRRQNLCTQVEAERLVSFANTADPLFMIGAVAVGMFGMPQLGVTLAIAHYIAALLVGFAMRFHNGPGAVREEKKSPGYFSRALKELVKARINDGRPFGQLFNESVLDTFSSMLFVGGCIMMFSVLIRVLTVGGAIEYVSNFFVLILPILGVDPAVAPTVVSGIFEITIGTQSASLAQTPLMQKALAASFVIGWSGLSVHTQVAAMVHGTDVRMWPYLCARFLHGILAAIATVILMGPASEIIAPLTNSITVFSATYITSYSFLDRLLVSTKWSATILLSLILIGMVVSLSQRIVGFMVKAKRN